MLLRGVLLLASLQVPGRVRALMLGHLEHAVALTIRVCKQQQ